jgi:ATP-dependent exoDNAse (exonuclease V) beta subunit
VDFSEITEAAVTALGGDESPSDLLYALDYRIEHLLVDEFQDTSLSQYRLLKSLTGQWSYGDGRTLFLVGDPMQSIYLFRQADVGLFMECWAHGSLGAVALERISLSANFRSTPELVRWTEKVLSVRALEEEFQANALEITKAQANPEKSGPPPTTHAFIKGADGTAARVVEILRSLPSPSRAAILVRSRANLVEILPALRAAEIPYEAVEIDVLNEQQHIIDVLALTRAVLHPGDRTSWLACLRAPWCGLTLADLAMLAEHDDRTVGELLTDTSKVGSLSPDAQRRLRRVSPILLAAVSQLGRFSVRDLVQRAWLALGGPAVMLHRVHLEDIDTLLDMIDQADEGGTIRDFVQLKQRLEFLFARSVPNPDAVKVMTIHAAKGLEFDTVILPALHSKGASRKSELLIWSGDRIATDNEEHPDYATICDERKWAERREVRRLLYVAVTRAQRELHLLGTFDPVQNGFRKPDKDSFLRILRPEFADWERALFKQTNGPKAQALISATGQPRSLLRRLPSSWRVPSFEHSVAWRPVLTAAPASGRVITYEWVGDASRYAGTVVHEMLKRIASEGLGSWSEARIRSLEPFVRSELARVGVVSSSAAEKVLHALQNTMASERGRWILQEHAESRSEWAITGQVGDHLVNGSVDRAFRDAEGTFWVIDFKTSEHKGGDLAAFLDEEHRRYRLQLENYSALVAGITAGPIRMGLYFPLHDAWREWAYADELSASYTSH